MNEQAKMTPAELQLIEEYRKAFPFRFTDEMESPHEPFWDDPTYAQLPAPDEARDAWINDCDAANNSEEQQQ